jgi:hypothetical protein
MALGGVTLIGGGAALMVLRRRQGQHHLHQLASPGHPRPAVGHPSGGQSSLRPSCGSG